MTGIAQAFELQRQRIATLEAECARLAQLVEAIPQAAVALDLLPLSADLVTPVTAGQAQQLLDEIGGLAERWLAWTEYAGKPSEHALQAKIALRRERIARTLAHTDQPS